MGALVRRPWAFDAVEVEPAGEGLDQSFGGDVRGSVERNVHFVVAPFHSGGLPIDRFDVKGDGQGRKDGVGNVDLVSQKVGVGKRGIAETNRNLERCRKADGGGSEVWRLGRWCVFGKLGEVFEVEGMVQSIRFHKCGFGLCPDSSLGMASQSQGREDCASQEVHDGGWCFFWEERLLGHDWEPQLVFV